MELRFGLGVWTWGFDSEFKARHFNSGIQLEISTLAFQLDVLIHHS